MDASEMIPREPITLPPPPKNRSPEGRTRYRVEFFKNMRVLNTKQDAVWVELLTGIPAATVWEIYVDLQSM